MDDKHCSDALGEGVCQGCGEGHCECADNAGNMAGSSCGSEDNTFQSLEECLSAIHSADFFSEPDDPRSIHYKRVIVRPKISLIKTLLNIVIPIAVIVLLCLLLLNLNVNPSIVVIGGICALALYFFIRLKGVIIWFIKLYQKLAPEHIRQRCLFEPSCSNYVIQALEKYGLFRGLKKGINRMRRCRTPNGGFDPIDDD